MQVQAGGRLVEKHHRGLAGQAGGQVKPPAHTTGVGRDSPAGDVGETELLEQLAGAARAGGELSLDRIVDAGIRLADSEGLAAVSMSRVAAAIGASTMALYRYVTAKDELLGLMVDSAHGSPPGPEPGEGWRPGLARWARAGTSEKMSVILLLTGYVRNAATVAAQVDAAFLAAAPAGQDAMSAYTRLLGRLIDPYRFPGLTAVLASGVLDTTDEWDDEFTFGLERVLDGIGALVAARA